ncbi:hypothetical protein GUITHDRAFT_136362 [Guillardia theta CCMP2712]|uniref:RAP domain-containing protein n=1 Tax=Guillardia theta (strain CCMP2712) TaxID=905079 RepID=L1JL24_GUITC|nr:hypothetical protein GUITHDRAFT_136362 [Guillardia theta CCMP2712]EKX49216.1 hypothetical protein GUITHDRAFT_136362 [Guillardia theta CCMP2712]|eukprot:XP_005836196.1 hypothetical protein GUITHDRAFT_136362 [Guillardia theta CCMP2712]
MACVFHGRRLALNCGNVINSRCNHVVVQLNRNKSSRSNRFALNFSTSCLSKGETIPWLPVKQLRSRRPWSTSWQQPRLLSFQQGCDDHCESVREQINEVTSSEDLFDVLQALRSKGLALSLSDGVHALQKMSRLQAPAQLSEKEKSMCVALVRGINQRVLKGGEELDIDIIPLLAHALAKLRLQDSDVLGLIRYLRDHLITLGFMYFRHVSLSNILWAFATVGFTSDAVLLKFQARKKNSFQSVESAQRILSPRISIFSEQGIGNVLWAVATIGVRSENFKSLFEVSEEEVLHVDRLRKGVICEFNRAGAKQQTSNVVKMDDVELEKSDGMDKSREQELHDVGEAEDDHGIQTAGRKFFTLLIDCLRSCDSGSKKSGRALKRMQRVWDLETCSRLLVNILKLPSKSIKVEMVQLISSCILQAKSTSKVSNKLELLTLFYSSPSSMTILELLIAEFSRSFTPTSRSHPNRREFKNFSPSELTKAIWAFTVSGCYKGARVIQDKCFRLFLEEGWLKRSGWDLSSVSSLSWSCMKAENEFSHMHVLEDYIATLQLSKGDIDDLSSLLWIHVVLGRERLDYIELLLEPIFARLDECRAANLTQIAQALVAVSPLRKSEKHDGQLRQVLKKLGATWKERKLPPSSVTHSMEYRFLSGIFLIDIVLFKNKKAIVAVEVDGPMHFNRVADGDSFRYVRSIESRWKEKILRQEGLIVVSIPFYEWDRLQLQGNKELEEAYLLSKLTEAGVTLEELDRLPPIASDGTTAALGPPFPKPLDSGPRKFRYPMITLPRLLWLL